MDAHMGRPGHLGSRAVTEGVARTNHQTLAATCMPAITCLACGTGAPVAPRLLLACEVQQPCSDPAPLSQRLAGLLEDPLLLAPRQGSPGPYYIK